MRILFGSTNAGKVIELKDCLTTLPLSLLSLADLDAHIDPPKEVGHSYKENATLKARHYSKISTLPTIADDSGIVVHALKDELGLHTRRWGKGEDASDEDWISYFLARMKKEKDRRAVFSCHLAFVDSEGLVHSFEGVTHGVITDSLEADYLPGIPISACFRPDGCEHVFSALSPNEKNQLSHRGKAGEALREFLQERFF